MTTTATDSAQINSLHIDRVSFEHSVDGFGIGVASPRISWRFGGSAQNWLQQSYDIRIQRDNSVFEEFHVESAQSNLVPWPPAALQSRESAIVSVKANGADGVETGWHSSRVEASLLHRSDWRGEMISATEHAIDNPKRPFYVIQEFEVQEISVGPARLYVTAFGLYDIELNGQTVGTQVLKPGWTSYAHRLYFQTFDVTPLLKTGKNVIRGLVAEGWYSGRLGFLGGKRNLYGTEPALLAQLMIGEEVVVKTDSTWKWAPSEILTAEIYDGEVYDARVLGEQTSVWQSVKNLDFPAAKLSPDLAPIRRMEEVTAKALVTTPSGRLVVDFGQNLVGWVRINRGPRGTSLGHKLVFSHAEVLEHGELGTRPLRIAKCQDTIFCGTERTSLDGWEPRFTFHGFRYLQIDGWVGEFDLTAVTAIVIHTDMERTGWFTSSHPLINKLHQNVTWGMRGNFVGLPTDCPQRDERLGWTGDLQVFCKTANFLYDTHSMLQGWLQDLAAEQIVHNEPSLFVPNIMKRFRLEGGPKGPIALAVWGDVVVLSPWDLYEAFADKRILEQQYESMLAWLTKGIPRNAQGLWGQPNPAIVQLGDWLDPSAPPDFPGDGRTDPMLVANAYLVHVTRTMARICSTLGKENEAERFKSEYQRLAAAYADNYVSKAGRTVSDSQTALALSLRFNLLTESQRAVAASRLDELVRANVFKVGTGFAGTPLILDVLADNDKLHLAYRMLQEKQCPSWLYCVSMGATTVWERWDSMRPDGSINPGEMTSFNHYAFGAVAAFLHRTVGGISPIEPGWKRILIAPRPGGTLTSAEVKHLSPFGIVQCSWGIRDDQLVVEAIVPPNTTALVQVGDMTAEVGSGEHRFVVSYEPDARWPPKPIWYSMTIPLIDEIA